MFRSRKKKERNSLEGGAMILMRILIISTREIWSSTRNWKGKLPWKFVSKRHFQYRFKFDYNGGFTKIMEGIHSNLNWKSQQIAMNYTYCYKNGQKYNVFTGNHYLTKVSIYFQYFFLKASIHWIIFFGSGALPGKLLLIEKYKVDAYFRSR